MRLAFVLIFLLYVQRKRERERAIGPQDDALNNSKSCFLSGIVYRIDHLTDERLSRSFSYDLPVKIIAAYSSQEREED